MNLVQALERFNRKERYWLIKAALGPAAQQLDTGFCAGLQTATGVDVPPDAWWAMDYHIGWVVAAMAMLSSQSTSLEPQLNGKQLVKGTQEDMDLVVSFGETLILIEAKGESSWSNDQFNRKIKRLDVLLASGLVPPPHKVFVVLLSPRGAGRLSPPEGESWPKWLCRDGTLRHMVLEMPRSFLKVSCWSMESGKPSHWHIVPASGAA